MPRLLLFLSGRTGIRTQTVGFRVHFPPSVVGCLSFPLLSLILMAQHHPLPHLIMDLGLILSPLQASVSSCVNPQVGLEDFAPFKRSDQELRLWLELAPWGHLLALPFPVSLVTLANWIDHCKSKSPRL